MTRISSSCFEREFPVSVTYGEISEESTPLEPKKVKEVIARRLSQCRLSNERRNGGVQKLYMTNVSAVILFSWTRMMTLCWYLDRDKGRGMNWSAKKLCAARIQVKVKISLDGPGNQVTRSIARGSEWSSRVSLGVLASPAAVASTSVCVEFDLPLCPLCRPQHGHLVR